MTAGAHTFSVGEFAQLVRDQLAQVFPSDIWIQGEVRGISRPPSGHVYFDLADPTTTSGQAPDALLSVVLMKTTKQIVNRQIKSAGGGVRIADGVNLRIRCAPDFYPPRGQFQLRMNAIDPSYTLGQLAAARELLLRQLAADGLMDRNASVAFPLAPVRIGLVTAPGSAAAADFLDELARSAMGWDVVLARTPVQGDGAHLRISAAIRACVRRGVDVVAVVRGGGARTDLVAFDHEHVARAIAQCPVPVLTGIGHEVDTSVADEVAHLALKTPTACAAHLVEVVTSTGRRTDETWASIVRAARAHLGDRDAEVAELAASARRAADAALHHALSRTANQASVARHLVERQLDRRHGTLDRAAATVRLQARHRVARAGDKTNDVAEEVGRQARRHLVTAALNVDNLDERRRLLDPARALARGWSITTDTDGRLVRSATDVSLGASMVTRVADGLITSTVESTEGREPSEDQP